MNKGELRKRRLYEIIEASRDHDKASSAYDFMILTAVLVGMVPMTMKTGNIYTKWIDLITVCIFIMDYLLRIYTADYKMGVKSYISYIAYAISPMAIIDLLSITPVIGFLLPGNTIVGMFRMLRLLRIFQLLRVLKLFRYSKTLVTIVRVAKKVKNQLLAVLILTFMYIITSALLIFQIEPNLFNSFFDAMYWATISITTIGYGDISPLTSVGRFITMISALVGVAIIALPSGIITAAYMDEINKHKSKLEL